MGNVVGGVSYPKKFGWGVLYGGVAGAAGYIIGALPQVQASSPLLQAVFTLASAAIVGGLAKFVKALAGKAGA